MNRSGGSDGGPRRWGVLRGAIAWWVARPAVLRWLAVLLWGAWIWWVSSRPAGPGAAPLWRNLLSNAAHVGVYGVLCALAVWALGDPRLRPASLRIGPVLALLYGIVDEWHQSAVPGRVSSWSDLAADGCGAGLAAVLLAWWHRGGRFPWLPAIALAIASCGAVAWSVWG